MSIKTINLIKGSQLTDEILLDEKYKNVTYLDITDNPNVTTLNHLPNLKVLNISGNCGVDENGIVMCTNIESLNIRGNTRIKDLSKIDHLTNIKVLHLNNNATAYNVD